MCVSRREGGQGCHSFEHSIKEDTVSVASVCWCVDADSSAPQQTPCWSGAQVVAPAHVDRWHMQASPPCTHQHVRGQPTTWAPHQQGNLSAGDSIFLQHIHQAGLCWSKTAVCWRHWLLALVTKMLLTVACLNAGVLPAGACYCWRLQQGWQQQQWCGVGGGVQGRIPVRGAACAAGGGPGPGRGKGCVACKWSIYILYFCLNAFGLANTSCQGQTCNSTYQHVGC